MRKNIGKKSLNSLSPGDTIGIIALSAPAEKTRLQAGLAYLEQLGFKTKVALDPTANYGFTTDLFSSDSVKNRVKGLHALFEDPEVKVVINTRGGYGAMEILPSLDFKLLAKNPKPFIGFSDTTALLIALSQRSKVTVIHGPVLEFGFARAVTNPTVDKGVQGLMRYLTEGLNPFEDMKFEYLKGKGSATGIICGGNLSIICALMGTPWEIDPVGKILFIEEVGERPYRIHRMLLQLKLAGKLEKLAAVLVGNFKDCEHPKGEGPSVKKALEDIFKGYSFPVLTGIPAGHGEENYPVPMGVPASIAKGKLSFI